MLDLGIFGLEFKKIYYHTWNQHPRISPIAKFHEKLKMPKFGTKNALFVYFLVGIWKKYCLIWNQRVGICVVA